MIKKEKKIACFVFSQVFDLVRYAVPHMPKGGAIINVGSIQA
jgi:NAD(P)-dependent dehydrogenase (short-subunit alcohol dehydrogenase family)